MGILGKWANRAPAELIEPHRHAVAAIRLLHALGASGGVFPEKSETNRVHLVHGIVFGDPSRPDSVRDQKRLAISQRRIEQASRQMARDVVSLAEHLTQGDLALAAVEEDFGRAAREVVKFRHLSASSFHRLTILLTAAEFDVTFVRTDLGGFGSEDEIYDFIHSEEFTVDTLAQAFAQVAGLRNDFAGIGIDVDEFFYLDGQLEQELFRAWKQKYPGAAEGYQKWVDTETANQQAPDPVPVRKLSPMKQTILGVITQAGHRMTADEIINVISSKEGVASRGTIKNYLSSLRDVGLLTNRQDVAPSGYGLPEWE